MNALNTDCPDFEWCLGYFQKFGNHPNCEQCKRERIRELQRGEEDDVL